MKAYQARDIVRQQFNIALNTLATIEDNGKGHKTMLNSEGVRGILLMLQNEIVDDLFKLEQREVDEVVKEVMG